MVDVGRLVDSAAARAKRATADAGRIGKLVAAALEAVEAHGPNVGMGRIAELAGIPRPHVYRYFNNKDELDLEVVRVATSDLATALAPSLTITGTVTEIVTEVVKTIVHWAGVHPQLFRFVASQPGARELMHTELLKTFQTYMDGAGLNAQVPPAGVAAVIGMGDAGITWWLDHPEEETEEQVVLRLSRYATAIVFDFADRLGLTIPETMVFAGPES
jgi:AcrR family transcriptional regulator